MGNGYMSSSRPSLRPARPLRLFFSRASLRVRAGGACAGFAPGILLALLWLPLLHPSASAGQNATRPGAEATGEATGTVGTAGKEAGAVRAPTSSGGGVVTVDARLGDAIAAYALQRFTRARRAFRMLAEDGNAEAAWRLARMIEAGIGGPADREEALHWYVRAARAGHEKALARLVALGLDAHALSATQETAAAGGRTEGGTAAGRERHALLDRASLARLAGEGRVWAMIELARRLAAGRGGPVDPEGALRWLERAQALSDDPRERRWLEESTARLRRSVDAVGGGPSAAADVPADRAGADRAG